MSEALADINRAIDGENAAKAALRDAEEKACSSRPARPSLPAQLYPRAANFPTR